ncbi:hypothetical protein IAT38_002484 [Cryptococcus sp. DSM 104549]
MSTDRHSGPGSPQTAKAALKRRLPPNDSPASTSQTQQKPVKKRRTLRPGRCANCGCSEEGTSLWRTNVDAGEGDGRIVCNACGLWRAEHGFARPIKPQHLPPVHPTPVHTYHPPNTSRSPISSRSRSVEEHLPGVATSSVVSPAPVPSPTADSDGDTTIVDDVVDAAHILMDISRQVRGEQAERDRESRRAGGKGVRC